MIGASYTELGSRDREWGVAWQGLAANRAFFVLRIQVFEDGRCTVDGDLGVGPSQSTPTRPDWAPGSDPLPAIGKVRACAHRHGVDLANAHLFWLSYQRTDEDARRAYEINPRAQAQPRERHWGSIWKQRTSTGFVRVLVNVFDDGRCTSRRA